MSRGKKRKNDIKKKKDDVAKNLEKEKKLREQQEAEALQLTVAEYAAAEFFADQCDPTNMMGVSKPLKAKCKAILRKAEIDTAVKLKMDDINALKMAEDAKKKKEADKLSKEKGTKKSKEESGHHKKETAKAG